MHGPLNVKLFGYTVWFKKMDSIFCFYISWTINDIWIIYITFESLDAIFLNMIARALAHIRATASFQSIRNALNTYLDNFKFKPNFAHLRDELH